MVNSVGLERLSMVWGNNEGFIEKQKNIKACMNVNDYGYAVTDSVGLR